MDMIKTIFAAPIITGTKLPKPTGESAVNDIYIWVFSIIGGLAVLFLVIGGAQYALSKGEPANIEKAKNQIRYSLIGLVIAAFGGAITNLVINRL
jgi:ABC-type Fe3+-siderophore transport system permease subunit